MARMKPMWALATLLGCSSPGGSPTPDAAGGGDTPDAPATCPAPSVVDNATSPELAVVGDTNSAAGIFDPSIVYPAGAPAGAMAYSSVWAQQTIRTRIAVSSDAGATWTYATDANTPEAVTLTATDCGGATCSGNLISEVTSLVYDGDDPDASKRWKLFAHRYLLTGTTPQDLRYHIGTIALQTAAQVEGPWTAPQKWIGWNTASSPYPSSGIQTNANALPGMADCLALTEPSALWVPGSIHLAVGCVYPDAGTLRIRIELLRSIDHAMTWQHVSTLLRPADASCLVPGASINAAELFVDAGNAYVIASPSDDAGYHGCLIYPLDLAAGTVRRAADGTALPTRTITTMPTHFAGACSFAAGAGGYVLPVAFLAEPRVFRMFRTGIATP